MPNIGDTKNVGGRTKTWTGTYWRTGSPKIDKTVPPTTTKTDVKIPDIAVTNIAKPNEARTAIKDASTKGAFQLPDQTDSNNTPAGKLTYRQFRDGGYTAAGGYQGYLGGASLVGGKKQEASMPTQSEDSSLSATNVLASDKKKVEAQMAQDQQDLYDDGFDLFGENNPIEKSSLDVKVTDSIQKRKAAQLLEEQAAETKFLQEQQARQEALDVAAYGRFSKQATSAIGATRAAFAQGRDGLTSASNPQLIDEYTGEMQDRIKEANIRLEAARAQRERTRELLKKAQQQGKESLVEAYSKQLAAAEATVRDRDTEYIKTINEANKTALDLQLKTAQANSAAFNIFEKMPEGGLVDMEIPDIAAMMGVDEVTASTLKSLDVSRSNLDPEAPGYLMAKARQDKAINEAKWSGMGQKQKEFMQYQEMLKDDPVQAKQFAKFTGIIDTPSVKEAAEAAKINYETAEKYYQDHGAALPINSKYEYEANGGTVSWGKSLPAQSQFDRVECGAMVNDALFGGPGYFEDSFESKMAYNNSDEPVAGGAFMMDLGTVNGHCGIVERVDRNSAGEITGVSVRDTNATYRVRPNGDKVKRGEIDTAYFKPSDPEYQKIKGWYAPRSASAGGGSTEAMDIAKAIMNPNSTQKLTDVSVKDNLRSRVDTELNKLKETALVEGNTIGAMMASAGGGKMDATARGQFIKTATVIDQLGSLNTMLNKKKITGKDEFGNEVDLSPFTGWIKSKNPWSNEGQLANAALQATIPNLARGVYGEVGVLTDRDVELYRKTLPNLTQPADIRKSVTALTLRSLRNSLDRQIRTQAGSGVDMSGLVKEYQGLDAQVNKMEAELGIRENGAPKHDVQMMIDKMPFLSESDYTIDDAGDMAIDITTNEFADKAGYDYDGMEAEGYSPKQIINFIMQEL